MSQRIRLPLLLLRLGVFTVMLMWTLDKLVRPEHAAAVFRNLLYFAAWSMLSACVALYLLRDLDTLWTLRKG